MKNHEISNFHKCCFNRRRVDDEQDDDHHHSQVNSGIKIPAIKSARMAVGKKRTWRMSNDLNGNHMTRG